jgi:hypothetical protein
VKLTMTLKCTTKTFFYIEAAKMCSPLYDLQLKELKIFAVKFEVDGEVEAIKLQVIVSQISSSILEKC